MSALDCIAARVLAVETALAARRTAGRAAAHIHRVDGEVVKAADRRAAVDAAGARGIEKVLYLHVVDHRRRALPPEAPTTYNN